MAIQISKTPTPRVAAMYTELSAFTGPPLDRPTRADRNAVMSWRGRLAAMRDSATTEAEKADFAALYVMGTAAANRQEDFYERNGNKFAEEAVPA